MIHKFVVSLLTVLVLNTAFSQKLTNIAIDFSFPNPKAGDKIYLAYHLGNQQFISDTLTISSDLKSTLKRDKLAPGLYICANDKKESVEFILNESKFSLTVDFKSLEITASNSKENLAFKSYMSFIAKNNKKAGLLDKNQANYNIEIEKISKEVEDFQSSFLKKNKGLLVSKFLNASIDNYHPKTASVQKNKSKEEAQKILFIYYKDHFFDNIDFSEEGLIRTPILESKIDTYIEKICEQNTDTLIKEYDYLLSKAKANKEVFKNTLINLFNKSTRYGGCGDKIYVHLGNKYYKNGKAFWIKEEQLKRILKDVKDKEGTLCGDIIENVSLINGKDFKSIDSKNNKTSLHGKDSDYTLIYFYVPSIKENMLEIQNEQLKLLDEKVSKHTNIKGLYIASVLQYEQNWMKILEMNDIDKTLHLFDPEIQFSRKHMPHLYGNTILIDKNGKILNKSIDDDSIDDLLKYYGEN